MSMDQIAQAMTSIDDGTAQFVGGAQAVPDGAGDLSELAAKLAGLTDRYRV